MCVRADLALWRGEDGPRSIEGVVVGGVLGGYGVVLGVVRVLGRQ